MAGKNLFIEDAKQAALDALDDVLGARVLTRGQKLEALRHIAQAAARMVQGIERGMRDEGRREGAKACARGLA